MEIMEYVTARELSRLGIAYTVNRHQTAAFTCKEVAAVRKLPLSQILKCMVGRDASGRVYVMMLPGDRTLKIKKLRHMLDGVRVYLMPSSELAEKYGVIVGAISPLQFIGKAEFYLDRAVLRESEVDVSSGSPYAGILVKTTDLISALNPVLCDIISTRAAAPR